ncbi:hypothetical protein MKW92_016935, partial [Papaver armeniacum]
MEDKYFTGGDALEKQSEVLMKAYRSMSHELHRIQICFIDFVAFSYSLLLHNFCFLKVEEEMHKFYEVTCGQGLNQK